MAKNLKRAKKKNQELYDVSHKKEEETDLMTEMNKNMSLTMPFLAVMVSLVAPLGLALYWLVNNILMIFERLVLNKILDSKKEA